LTFNVHIDLLHETIDSTDNVFLWTDVLSLYLIDVVSGTVVFSIMHRRAKEPYHIVHSENWLLYTYFSDKYRRTELTTLEMYEGKTQSNATAFSSVTFSSFQPIVERQSFILPANVLALKETITEKGITSKHILGKHCFVLLHLFINSSFTWWYSC
jgi:hypothetical protein